MKRNIILLILSLFAGCANQAKSDVGLLVAFNAEMHHFIGYSIDFPIVFGDQEEMDEANQVGACTVNTKTRKPMFIEINKKHWDKGGAVFKQALILHELGHCLLDLGHTKGDSDLMNPSVRGSILCVFNKGAEKCVKEARGLK